MAQVLLALGSNLGDREYRLQRALQRLQAMPGFRLLRVSTFLETKPFGGGPAQRDFFNAALLGQTSLAPLELLRKIKELETAAGRKPGLRFGPRPLDIDILLYGSKVIKTPTLTIPHPRMLSRDFVMQPVMEIAAELVHPLRMQSLAEIMRES